MSRLFGIFGLPWIDGPDSLHLRYEALLCECKQVLNPSTNRQPDLIYLCRYHRLEQFISMLRAIHFRAN
ncbi:hypothetical protein QNH00_gp31 [Yersinia phage PYps16N]|uniref:Uncharacterized protein n=1 Tax=Yersinia phage PYps16N TaxID=2801354 RepID=A0AAE7P7A2_9CAUD|nr:hypothetical protein QNH00_gp31 [Yersinia phage PYps16N]QQO91204.1 hypothetical protein ORF031 [Yersinia phage PYps16N]